MSDYRRWFVPGGTYFFTVVTYNRYPFFRDDLARLLLGTAIREVQRELPFEMTAIVLLPEHLHCIWTLPSNDANYPERWTRIKERFTTKWIKGGGHEEPVTAAQQERGNRGIWQRRYWEHTIQDQRDLEQHCDYIHYNPVKHGLVSRVVDWQWSSFHRFVAEGQYSSDWGRSEPPGIVGLDFE
ncbi:MAG: transposase [Planctomycetota bacterium]|nr:transposase [Planctomycetota bacterium]